MFAVARGATPFSSRHAPVPIHHLSDSEGNPRRDLFQTSPLQYIKPDLLMTGAHPERASVVLGRVRDGAPLTGRAVYKALAVGIEGKVARPPQQESRGVLPRNE